MTKHLKTYAFLLFSAILGILFLSSSTSPLYNNYGGDSAVFQTIGKYWCEGRVPYVELFDHKGPLIHFINAVGYGLTQDKKGIVFIEIIFLFFTELFAFRILKKNIPVFVSSVLAGGLPLFVILNWEGGNLTEEYILPFLMLSFYCILQWFNDFSQDVHDHKLQYAFVYGITFGVALMTRVTNALGIIIPIAFITLDLIGYKKWKKSIYNMMALLLGIFIITIPFCVYFYKSDALYEMWYGTLLYNFDYLANTKTNELSHWSDFIVFVRITLSGWCLFLGAGLKVVFTKENKNFFWILCALIHIFFLLNLQKYSHYSLCLVPYLYVTFTLLADNNRLFEIKKYNVSQIVVCLLSSIVLINSIYFLYCNPLGLLEEQINSSEEYYELIEYIPSDERNNFVAFDCPPDIYLKMEVSPDCTYFVHQSWQAQSSIILSQKIIKCFDECNVKWILMYGDNKRKTLIDDILNTNYRKVMLSSQENYSLYRMKSLLPSDEL